MSKKPSTLRIKDDFKQKQVKDVNQVKSSVNQMANNLEDHTIELS
jgi:hypothetical protein